MNRPLRAYIVTHYALTQINNVVAARTAKEALQKDEDGAYFDEGWAGEESGHGFYYAKQGTNEDD